jgi:predicted amidohydrolase
MITPHPFTAGIIQFDVKTGDTESNLAVALGKIDTLSEQGADLVLLPEMWSCGFDNRNLNKHAGGFPAILDTLSRKAKQQQVIIAGTMPEEEDGDIYNTMVVIDTDGSVAGAYRKIHLFSPTREHEYFSAGEYPVVCDTPRGRIGLMICYDLRFPELCRALALKGAWVVLVAAQWPAERIGHWKTLLQARAVENQFYMVAANCGGTDGKLTYGGCSRIVSPFGEIVAESEDKSPVAIIAKIDPREMDKCRQNVTYLDDRAPKAYEGLV